MKPYRYVIETTGNGKTSHVWLALTCAECQLQLHTTTPNRTKFVAVEPGPLRRCRVQLRLALCAFQG